MRIRMCQKPCKFAFSDGSNREFSRVPEMAFAATKLRLREALRHPTRIGVLLLRGEPTRNQKELSMPNKVEVKERRKAPLATPSDIRPDAVKDISGALNALLADVFALYLKTKNFHWHMSGPHFRDYHLLLDEQADQIFAISDAIAERARKIGGTTIRSIGHISRLQRLTDNDQEFVPARD